MSCTPSEIQKNITTPGARESRRTPEEHNHTQELRLASSKLEKLPSWTIEDNANGAKLREKRLAPKAAKLRERRLAPKDAKLRERRLAPNTLLWPIP